MLNSFLLTFVQAEFERCFDDFGRVRFHSLSCQSVYFAAHILFFLINSYLSSLIMDQETFFRITNDFLDPKSKNFMNVNFGQIAKSLNQDKATHPISADQALEVSQSLSFLSKLREVRLLRGKKRKASFRSYQCYSPQHIMVAGRCSQVETKHPMTLTLKKPMIMKE